MSQAKTFHSPVFGIAGWKKSGKTTLTSRLVEHFTKQGLRVAAVKHAHDGFDIDNGDTDSARHRRSGAQQVAIVSQRRWAVVSELAGQPEPDFAQMIHRLAPCDLILVEGYKSAAIPKIEARRRQSVTQTPLSETDPLVVCVASDHDSEAKGVSGEALPHFDLDDIEAIAGLIAAVCQLNGPTASTPSDAPQRDDSQGVPKAPGANSLSAS